MDERRKTAYRFLLYWAMLDIRPVRGIRWSWNPFRWRRQEQQVQRAGAIADWLHNLAMFSAVDFDHFDEARFWNDYQRLLDHYEESGLVGYRLEFERQANALENVAEVQNTTEPQGFGNQS